MRPELSVFEKLPRDFNTHLELSLEGTPLSISGSLWKMFTSVLRSNWSAKRGSLSFILSFSGCAPFYCVPPSLLGIATSLLSPIRNVYFCLVTDTTSTGSATLPWNHPRAAKVPTLGLGPVDLNTNNNNN